MEKEVWFALATSYCRELAVKNYFGKKNMECYVPMKWRFVEIEGKRYRELIPAIHNLLFVHSTRKDIQSIKADADNSNFSFRWLIDTVAKSPIVIQDSEMQNFIKVCETKQEGLTFLETYDISSLNKGDYVKVTTGPFKDVKGYLVQFQKDHCVLAIIKGVVAVATTVVHPTMFEKIK